MQEMPEELSAFLLDAPKGHPIFLARGDYAALVDSGSAWLLVIVEPSAFVGPDAGLAELAEAEQRCDTEGQEAIRDLLTAHGLTDTLGSEGESEGNLLLTRVCKVES